MADLVERYIYEVGRYLPKKERAEIQAELRSQIIEHPFAAIGFALAAGYLIGRAINAAR